MLDDDTPPPRIVALRTLIGAMLAQSRPTQQLPIQPAVLPPDPAQLAREAARSAKEIAVATAALGDKGANNQELSNIIWRETLKQIGRIQKLHHMPEMPFQKQGEVKGPASDY